MEIGSQSEVAFFGAEVERGGGWTFDFFLADDVIGREANERRAQVDRPPDDFAEEEVLGAGRRGREEVDLAAVAIAGFRRRVDGLIFRRFHVGLVDLTFLLQLGRSHALFDSVTNHLTITTPITNNSGWTSGLLQGLGGFDGIDQIHVFDEDGALAASALVGEGVHHGVAGEGAERDARLHRGRGQRARRRRRARRRFGAEEGRVEEQEGQRAEDARRRTRRIVAGRHAQTSLVRRVLLKTTTKNQQKLKENHPHILITSISVTIALPSFRLRSSLTSISMRKQSVSLLLNQS